MVRRAVSLLVLLLAASAFAGNHNRHLRYRRDSDLHNWLTAEQKEALKDVPQGTAEFKQKVGVYYNQLSTEKRAEWDAFYKKHCFEWTAKVQTADEETAFQNDITENKAEKVKERVGELKKTLDSDAKKNVEMWEEDCYQLLKPKRARREIEAAFQDFVKWMTPDQLAEITTLKTSGKDAEIQGKVKEFFGQLPGDQQATLKEEFKGKCKTYFTPLLTPDELDKIKTLKSDREAAGALIKTVVDRQTGEVKAIAEKMFGVCGEVFKDSTRKRREIEAAFQDFVKWMTPDQLAEISTLKASGKEVQGKVKEFFGQLPADQQATLKEEFKGKCKTYFTPLMTPDELDKIKTLKTDREGAGALIKTVVDRQTGEVKTIAEKMFDVCGEVYKDASRKRREIEAVFQDFVKWMTPDQLAEITTLKTSGKDVQGKVKEFFGELPADQQASLKEEFKGKCRTYFGPLMTPDEAEKIKTLKSDREAAGALIKTVVDRQTGDVKAIAEKMFGVCGEVYKDSSRKRREIEAAFQDFVKWMTPDQLADITVLKSSGKESEIKEKVKEFFGQLPADRQASLTEEFKGKCRTYFGPLMTPEEGEKIKTLTGDKEAAGALIKTVVDRQTGEVKAIAEKMFGICGEVYKNSKSKRDVSSKIDKHLSWLKPEEKAEILKMTEEGKTKEEIKDRLLELANAKSSNAEEKEKTVKMCYAWMDEVATKEEIENLHKLHHVDHAACKKKVREFIGRLPAEKQEMVEGSLPVCEKIWYGEHDHHHHRKRRHLAVIENYVKWLDDAQKESIKQLEDSGAEFSAIADKIKEFFHQLPEDKQTEVKEKFQTQCMTWAKEVSKPLEWEDIKKFHAAQDFKALKLKLVELEERLTENQKHTIEHVRGVCYRLWGIKDVARRRRVVNEDNFQERAAKYLNWLSEEQLAELQRLKADGKKTEVMKAILKFYDGTSGDVKTQAEVKLKEACREYSVKAFGAEKVAEFKKLADEKADKEKIEKLAEGYVAEIEDETKREFAQAVVTGCKHVYASSRSRRALIAMEVAEYLQESL